MKKTVDIGDLICIKPGRYVWSYLVLGVVGDEYLVLRFNYRGSILLSFRKDTLLNRRADDSSFME